MKKEAERCFLILANMVIAGTVLYSVIQIVTAEPLKHPKATAPPRTKK